MSDDKKIVTRAIAIENLKQYVGKDLADYAQEFGISPFNYVKQNKGLKWLVLERIA